jgi:hypothetical protein
MLNQTSPYIPGGEIPPFTPVAALLSFSRNDERFIDSSAMVRAHCSRDKKLASLTPLARTSHFSSSRVERSAAEWNREISPRCLQNMVECKIKQDFAFQAGRFLHSLQSLRSFCSVGMTVQYGRFPGHWASGPGSRPLDYASRLRSRRARDRLTPVTTFPAPFDYAQDKLSRNDGGARC